MAKKNSSKTATEKALQASEPKLQVFTGWQGVNFKDSPLGWEPLETGRHDYRQTDLKPNFLMVQNNLETCDSLTVQTRPDSIQICTAPDLPEYEEQATKVFTGVSCLFHRWLFLVIRESVNDGFIEYIGWRDIRDKDAEWSYIHLYDAELETTDPLFYMIKEIGYYEGVLLITTMHISDSDVEPRTHVGEFFTCDINYSQQFDVYHNLTEDSIDPGYEHDGIKTADSVLYIDNPVGDDYAPQISAVGDLEGTMGGEDVEPNQWLTRLDVAYAFTNKFGSTMLSQIGVFYCNHDPVTYSSKRYITIQSSLPEWVTEAHQITGVDIYCSVDNKQTKAFIGRVDLTHDPETGEETSPIAEQAWKFDWLGSMADVSQWTNTQLSQPEENTTKGAPVSHFAIHDSRIYFWGDPDNPYRLYIGGNPGAELSVARGLGGGFIDIEPGTGIEINGTAKWKTYGGSNIVTMMCGNPNTNMVKRFNLVETNTTVTNEIASKGYMYEEVSNVVGCNSRWGYGVFADGLYSVSRYGVTLTTMAMEYNNQMRTTQVSDVIQPIFTERLGNRLKDCRMVCVDGVLYLILSEDASSDEPTNLDQVILCYDLDLKAWYTFTHDYFMGHGEKLLHAMPIDSDEYIEGLGIITDYEVRLYPTTGIQEEVAPGFDVILETGEISSRKPNQDFHYLCQLELHFDYFIGQADVYVEGTDYYGRAFTVHKKLNKKNVMGNFRDWVEWIRIDKYVESYRIRIIGKARFRLVSINSKAYTVSRKVGIVYGYDDHNHYRDHRPDVDDHHYIQDYNNLRQAIVP